MRRVHKQRLANAIRALKEAPDDFATRFSMETFMYPCGAPACVLGNYFLRPDLQDDFRVLVNGGRVIIRTPDGREFDHVVGGATDGSGSAVSTRGLWPYIERHFGMGLKLCNQLFGGEGCGNAKTRQQALRYLRKFYREVA